MSGRGSREETREAEEGRGREGEQDTRPWAFSLCQFRYRQMLAATNNFESQVLGEGSYGIVYEGNLTYPVQRKVAIKKLKDNGFQGVTEWLQELVVLSTLQHPNLVNFVGYCSENSQALLVYEYYEKGSLDKALFGDNPEIGPSYVLPWETRVRIALGTAMGLAFLHENNIIHRDLKAANILLTQDYEARLTDFGLATSGPDGTMTHISIQVMGTLGYLDPSFLTTGQLRYESDTYSFGVLLLELMTGMPACGSELVSMAKPLLFSEELSVEQLIDPRLEGNYNLPNIKKFAKIIRRCLLQQPRDRPKMKDIVSAFSRL